jgi:hypothetical protein
LKDISVNKDFLHHQVELGHLVHPNSTTATILCDGVNGGRVNTYIDILKNEVIQNSHILLPDLFGHSLQNPKPGDHVVTWGILEKDDFVGAVQYAKEKGFKQVNILTKSLGASAAMMAIPKLQKLFPDLKINIILDSAFSTLDNAVEASQGKWLAYTYAAPVDCYVGGYVEEAYPELKSVDMEKLSPLGSAEGVLDAVKNSKNIRILFLQGSHDKVTGAKKNGVGQLIKAIKDANKKALAGSASGKLKKAVVATAATAAASACLPSASSEHPRLNAASALPASNALAYRSAASACLPAA